MANLMKQGSTYIESKEPAENRIGQNGYQGPSSLLPGQTTAPSVFAPKDDEAKAILKAGGMSFTKQTRKISDRQDVPTAHGMKNPNVNPVRIPNNGRPVTLMSAMRRSWKV